MRLALAAAGIWLLAAQAHAAVLNWTATLDQAQEVPAPIAVAGAMGFAFGTLDDVSGALNWNVSWSGLSGAPVGLHFHAPAPAGATAGVVVNIGNLSGLNSPSVGMTTINATQIAGFKSGLWYINLHTALNPTGEIRGQASIVPVPIAAPLLVTALAAFGLFARRRRVPAS